MSTRSTAIAEEDYSHCMMDKSLSESAMKPLRLLNVNGNYKSVLKRKEEFLTRSIQNLQSEVNKADFILKNKEILNTSVGAELAKRTLQQKTAVGHLSPERRNSTSSCDRREVNAQVNNIKRDLFNTRARYSESNDEPNNASGFDELLNTLRLNCEIESGYDTDSTRAGADSPDSEQSIPPSMKPRSHFSMNLDDYQGIDLSLLPVNLENCNDNSGEAKACPTSTPTSVNLDDSTKTESTVLHSDNEDSCDRTLVIVRDDPFEKKASSSTMERPNSFSLLMKQQICKTPESKRGGKHSRKNHPGSLSTQKLLDFAESPCADTPPAYKMTAMSQCLDDTIPYFSPQKSAKRKKDQNSSTSPEQNRTKRQQELPRAISKPLVCRELKTIKLTLEKPGLGISVERKETARPYYVISKIEPNSAAAKSNQFRIGDEVVRVCGSRLRCMSQLIARNTLRTCHGVVELQIAREPMVSFTGELSDTWGDSLIQRTRSDSDVWSVQCNFDNNFVNGNDNDVGKGDKTPEREVAAAAAACGEVMETDEVQKECRVIEMKRKDGKIISCETTSTPKKDVDRKLTGMKKFVRTRNAGTPIRRATSLLTDMIMITLEKGETRDPIFF